MLLVAIVFLCVCGWDNIAFSFSFLEKEGEKERFFGDPFFSVYLTTNPRR